MPKSGKRPKKVRSHPYDQDPEETAPPRFNGAFDFSADAPYNNFLLRTEAAIPKPIAPIPDHGRALDKRSERARKRFGPILDALQHELLQFYTDRTFEEHQNVRKSYLRARTLGQTEEYLADVRRRSRLVFGRKSPNPFSTRILSSDGQTLLVYLAFRAPPEILQANKQQNKSQALRKKAKASDQPVRKDLDSSNKSTRVYFHGMPEDVRSRYHQATQMLLAFVPPEKPKESSRRHGGLDPTKQASYYTTHRGWDGKQELRPERVGTLHIVSCWTQRGHPTENMTHSSSIKSNAQAPHAHEKWFDITYEAHLYLSLLFEREFPEQFRQYQRAHSAAKWYRTDPGPYIGRVIVWKLHSTDHIDNEDGCPTATWTVGGSYTGGFLDFVDAETRFLYQPGHIVLGWTGFLFHKVTDWVCKPTATLDSQRVGVTPGRVAAVNYFPIASFNILKDKQGGWGRKTLYGAMVE